MNCINATLTLLQADGRGMVANFAADRGEGIMGVSLKVGNLKPPVTSPTHATHGNLPTYNYQGRERFLIPASATHGSSDRNGRVASDPLRTRTPSRDGASRRTFRPVRDGR